MFTVWRFPLRRYIAKSGCALPQVTLQRDTIDSSTSHGQFTIGTLPDGVDNSSLTWVPVRLYSTSEGGIQSPTFASNEVSSI